MKLAELYAGVGFDAALRSAVSNLSRGLAESDQFAAVAAPDRRTGSSVRDSLEQIRSSQVATLQRTLGARPMPPSGIERMGSPELSGLRLENLAREAANVLVTSVATAGRLFVDTDRFALSKLDDRDISAAEFFAELARADAVPDRGRRRDSGLAYQFESVRRSGELSETLGPALGPMAQLAPEFMFSNAPSSVAGSIVGQAVESLAVDLASQLERGRPAISPTAFAEAAFSAGGRRLAWLAGARRQP